MNQNEDLEKIILKTLYNKPLSIDGLIKELKLKTVEEIEKLSKILIKLQKEYKIDINKKYKYTINSSKPKKENIKEGILDLKRREDGSSFGFVQLEGIEKGIYINEKNLNNALDEEKVLVNIIGGRKDRLEGKIIEIIEKKRLDSLVGEVVTDSLGKLSIVFDDKTYKQVRIENNELNVVSGQKVLVKMNREQMNKCEILEVIGHKDEPGIDLLSIAYKRGFRKGWSNKAKEELKNIPLFILQEDISHRKDLRDKIIFTIDGDDTKDIDDAISIEILDNGNYLIGVHIADVTHYIKEQTALYEESYYRNTSVYMVNTVLPMLPAEISNGICSLNPNVDRLTLTCQVEVNKLGNIIKSEIFESVINSKKQMTYDNVNKILEENITPEGYENFIDKLKLMNDIALLIRKSKYERGMIEFSSDEIKFINENNIPVEIIKREQKSGEKLIEDFMILANEAVAEILSNKNYPVVFRVHEKPDPESVKELIDIAIELGIDIKDKNRNYGETPKDFQELMNIIKNDEKIYKLLGTIAKRTQKKAIYSTKNVGHFGLASIYYCHFTSPIRRFPDQLVHRIIKNGLINNILNTQKLESLETELTTKAEYASFMEKQATEAEREADDMKMAEMATYHLEEEFYGMVSGVIENGIFVELSNNIEGFLPVSELPKDYYKCVSKVSLVGNNNKYTIGDEIYVMIKSADKEKRTIDLSLLKPKILEKNDNKILTKKM